MASTLVVASNLIAVASNLITRSTDIKGPKGADVVHPGAMQAVVCVAGSTFGEAGVAKEGSLEWHWDSIHPIGPCIHPG